MTPPSPLRPIARRALAAQSDERLVRLLRDGHEPAFEEIVRRYRGPLVAFAAAIVSADGAEDVVQASLEKADRALRADSREIALRPWLFAIVRNGALNAIRGEPRVDELGEAMAVAAGPSEIAEQREDLDRLVLAICALPEAQRQALVKRELEGVGHGEIAAQLGTTSTAVRGLIFRARTGLRNAVGAAVPLPVLRSLLTEGAAAGAAGGGASIALLGGAGAKGGTFVAAAVIALGTGIAVEQSRRDRGGDGGQVAEAAASPSGGDRKAAAADPATGVGGSASPTGTGGGEAGSGVEGESGSGGEGGSESSGSSGPGPSAAEEERGDDSSSGHEADDDSSSGSGSGGDDGGGDSSGPGGDHQSPPPPPPDDDDHSGPGGDEGGHSGPGGGIEPPDEEDGGHSGPGGGGEEPEPLEPPEPIEPPEDDDSSGPGSGSSGSGHSGSGEDDT